MVAAVDMMGSHLEDKAGRQLAVVVASVEMVEMKVVANMVSNVEVVRTEEAVVEAMMSRLATHRDLAWVPY